MAVSDSTDDYSKRKDASERRHARFPGGFLFRVPWWLLILLTGWFIVVLGILRDPEYQRIYEELSAGISLTLYLALTSYFGSLLIGLVVGLVRSYPPLPPEVGMRPGKVLGRIGHTAVYNLLSVYVEFMRGIPPLVFLLIVGFIIIPSISDPVVGFLNLYVAPPLRDLSQRLELDYLLLFGGRVNAEVTWRGRDPATAIAGLSLVYGAFLSEVFRSGIQSIHRGQMEAAKSLGMTFFQAMRHIVIPQAVRRVLPELGNNFISMIKDTSLVTILGTSEITQLARQWSGSSFQYLQTYAVLSLMYLTMTVGGSMIVQTLENYLRVETITGTRRQFPLLEVPRRLLRNVYVALGGKRR
ncbi:MAG: amino acid ABC transporter permease [Anaerolineae bacterium]|jgi:polar amino acid transport system permease protein|nr:amino acid ABC transporter permease [Anaerolineae bacterium]